MSARSRRAEPRVVSTSAGHATVEITDLTVFRAPGLFARFGLPETLAG